MAEVKNVRYDVFRGKETQPLLLFVNRTKSHADWSAFVFEPEFTRCGRRRLKSIEDGLLKISEQVWKIEQLAERTGNQELLAILQEELEVLPVHD